MDGQGVGRVRGTRWRCTPRVLALACALLASPDVVRSENSILAQLGSTGPEKMVVQLVLNQESKGEYFVTIVEGKFLARAQDLKEIDRWP